MGFKMGGKKAKKSKLQIHRDDKKRKAAEAEADAERALQESIDYFATDDEPKEFVKGGTAKDGQFTASASAGERYLPAGAAKAAPPELSAADILFPAKDAAEQSLFDQQAAKEIAIKLPLKRKKEPSARELFLQELKQDQAAREARDAARKRGEDPRLDGFDGRQKSGFDAMPDDAYGGMKGSCKYTPRSPPRFLGTSLSYCCCIFQTRIRTTA